MYLPSTWTDILLLLMLFKENWYVALSSFSAMVISNLWILSFFWYKYFVLSGLISLIEWSFIIHHFMFERSWLHWHDWKVIVSEGDTTTGPDIKNICDTTKNKTNFSTKKVMFFITSKESKAKWGFSKSDIKCKLEWSK